MMSLPKLRPTLRLLCLIGAAGLSPLPTLAQDKPAIDLWSPPAAPSPGVKGGTPQLEGIFPADEARPGLQKKLEEFRQKGFLTARVGDVSKYSDQTVKELYELLLPDGDPCEQAVRAALMLDSHLEEADWMEVAKGIEKPAELVLETLVTLFGPDELGFVTKEGYTLEYLVTRISAVDKVLDANEAIQNARKHYTQSPAVRNGIWTQEVMKAAQGGGWTEQDIAAQRASLLDKAQGLIVQMGTIQSEIDDGLRLVDLRYENDTATALLKRQQAREELRRQMGLNPNYPLDMLDGAGRMRLDKIDIDYNADLHTAGKRRAADHQRVVDSFFHRMAQAQLDTEKALAQRDALARYAAPLARGDCTDIRRDGPVSRATKPPTATDQALKLPHDKLMTLLKRIGKTPSQKFMDCLCRAGGYGNSGTGQFYHPDTLGTYDERYSCQHPGDPCIVQGYGCTRHPLPSDPKAWESCGIGTGENITDAISAAVADRQANR
ncbi:hypothetical protein [Thalassovita sp.]|uniref:hypothetical protein n=1 Tax=Thalassovita sp. TaxID=1979401 RepID=UPI0029DE6D50|nr:hypothetical protein [Thalassovita sp.]